MGYQSIPSSIDNNVWLVRIDANGQHLWNQTYGSTSTNDFGFDIVEVSSGGFALVGGSDKTGASGILLIRTDSSGTQLWNTTYGHEDGYSIVECQTGGFALAGTTREGVSDGQPDYVLIRTDASGTEVWARRYGATGRDSCEEVIECRNGGFALIGVAWHPSGGSYTSFWLVRTDSNGNAMWNRAYDAMSHAGGEALVEVREGGFLIVGQLEEAGEYSIWLGRIQPIVWIDGPTNLNHVFGESFAYDLNASAHFGVNQWYLNDTINYQIDSNGIITNATYLLSGIYGLEVGVKDVYGDYINGSCIITVAADLIPPVWHPTPEDQYMGPHKALLYDLNASDPSGLDTWWINDTVQFTIDTNGIIENSTNLTPGSYGIQVWVNDTYDNVLTGKFSVFFEAIPPTWDENPENQIREVGTSFFYDLNASDASGIDHWWINDTTHFSIDGSGIIVNSTFLDVAVIWVEVRAIDRAGNYCAAEFSITVQDTISPAWVQAPVDQYLGYGEMLRYDLNATDFSGIDQWTINDTILFSIDSNGVITNTTNLITGIYGLSVWVNDTYGNLLADAFTIVIDVTPPTWDETPQDQISEYGTPFSHDVNASDPSGIDHWWINDTTHFSINSVGVITNVSSLAVGTYRLEVIVFDTYNNPLSASFTVTVADTTPPAWIEIPENQLVIYGTLFTYDLNASDISGIDYWWVNDTARFTVDENGVIIGVGEGVLDIGVYGLKVRVFDIYHNYQEADFAINVQDLTAPTWDQPPSDQLVEYGDNFVYLVNASDLIGIDHWWISDSTHFAINTNGIITNATPLVVTVYSLEIRAYNDRNNYCTKTIQITVIDSTPPRWQPIPSDQTFLYGAFWQYQLEAYDLSGVTQWSVNDSSRFTISESGVLTSVVPLDMGQYNLNVTAIDPYGNSISALFSVVIREPGYIPPPIWVPILIVGGTILGVVGTIFFLSRRRAKTLALLLVLIICVTSLVTFSMSSITPRFSTLGSVNYVSPEIVTPVASGPRVPQSTRVAIYNEPNMTLPSYAEPGLAVSNNYLPVQELLQGEGYAVDLITSTEIWNHKLLTKNYDVFVLVDNLPREAIVNHVKEFWLGGGGLLSLSSSLNYLCYAGILPPESLGTNGYQIYWKYSYITELNVTARHSMSREYHINDQIHPNTWNYPIFKWSALQNTAINNSLIRIATKIDFPNDSAIIGLDWDNQGGRIVQLCDEAHPIAEDIHPILLGAVNWITPHPKGRILFDLTSQPYYGIDSWDTLAQFAPRLSQFRTALVNSAYTVDKLYPSLGSLTADELSHYDLFIVVLPQVNFTAAEVAAITSWVNNGGSLWLLGDGGGGAIYDADEYLNYLLAGFDLQINTSVTLPATWLDYKRMHPTVDYWCKNLSTDVVGLINYTGSAAGIWGTDSANTVIAGQEYGKGRIILCGDTDWILDPPSGKLHELDNLRYVRNIANWLTACQADVLIYVDSPAPDHPNTNMYRGPVATALNELGIPFFLTSTDDLFESSLTSDSWYLVVIDDNAYGLKSYFDGSLLNYLKAGGRMVISTWNYFSFQWELRAFLGHSIIGSMQTTAPDIYIIDPSHDTYRTPHAYAADVIRTSRDYVYYEYCQMTILFENATAIAASYSPIGSPVILLSANDRVICNAMTLDTYYDDTDDSTYPDAFELWQNQIAYQYKPHCELSPAMDSQVYQGSVASVSVKVENTGIHTLYDSYVQLDIPPGLGILLSPPAQYLPTPFNSTAMALLTWQIHITGTGDFCLNFTSNFHRLPKTEYLDTFTTATHAYGMFTITPTFNPSRTVQRGTPLTVEFRVTDTNGAAISDATITATLGNNDLPLIHQEGNLYRTTINTTNLRTGNHRLEILVMKANFIPYTAIYSLSVYRQILPDPSQGLGDILIGTLIGVIVTVIIVTSSFLIIRHLRKTPG
ncbi:MAG: cadherin repeat domain-containing protein [Promethearchaeota archaeon]